MYPSAAAVRGNQVEVYGPYQGDLTIERVVSAQMEGVYFPVTIREFGAHMYHVHAKDTWLDKPNIALNGVLDTKPYTDEINRSWIFRTVGFGHGQEFWRSLMSELRLAGYDGVISIEHEDSLMSINEGFTGAVNFLKGAVISESPAVAWWV